jgi:hypothetical protein
MNLETAAPCRPISDFLDAPLPAVKTLWNAPDAVIWKKEYEHYLKQLGSGNVSTNGKLILLHAGAGTNDREAGWDDWFAGIDGLGVLVAIATSMLV